MGIKMGILMGKLSPYNIFAVRLNKMTTAVFKGI